MRERPRKCLECGTEFKPEKVWHDFCKEECKRAYLNKALSLGRFTLKQAREGDMIAQAYLEKWQACISRKEGVSAAQG